MKRCKYRGFAAAALGAALLGVLAPGAQATVFSFTLNGYFDAADSISGTVFAANTPFTMSAVFDSASRDLLPPVPAFHGFVAYSPASVTLAVDGSTYSVAAYSAAQPFGVAVALFDSTSMFGVPNHYAAGFIQNPVADGAGIVGDWLAATPPYSVSNLTGTTLTAADFFGVGFQSGVCTAPGPTPGSCNANAVTPIPLTLAGTSFALTLGNYDLNNPLFASDPGATPGAGTTAPFVATLVPEPASMVLLGAGLTCLPLFRRRTS